MIQTLSCCKLGPNRLLSACYDAFFQQDFQNTKQDVWYAAQPLGKNKLAGMMTWISNEVGLSKRYTNHCIRTRGFRRASIDLLSIMSLTGHRNVKSLDSYIIVHRSAIQKRLQQTLNNTSNLGINDKLPLTCV